MVSMRGWEVSSHSHNLVAKGEQMTRLVTRVMRKGTTVELHDHVITAVSYTHLRAHETSAHLVCRLLLEKKIF